MLETEVVVHKVGNIVDGKCKIKMTGYDAMGKSELRGVLTVARE